MALNSIQWRPKSTYNKRHRGIKGIVWLSFELCYTEGCPGPIFIMTPLLPRLEIYVYGHEELLAVAAATTVVHFAFLQMK